MKKKRKPNRLKGYDYSQDNLYFITSCVQERVCCFGEIVHSKMILNNYGHIANKQWYWLARQYLYVVLHEFVVMPNHIHGIIEIDRGNVGTGRVGTGRVRTGRDLSLLQIKIKSLSELIGAYKTTTSKQIHIAGFPEFAWHRSFHDHIIRNEESYINISNYILNNPSKWEEDKFYGKKFFLDHLKSGLSTPWFVSP
jgi:REP element-mobilizing transposase RayT